MNENRAIESVADRYEDHVDWIVDQLQSSPPLLRKDNSNAGIRTLWGQWVADINERHHRFFDELDNAVWGLCCQVVRAFTEEERRFFWESKVFEVRHEDGGEDDDSEKAETGGADNELGIGDGEDPVSRETEDRPHGARIEEDLVWEFYLRVLDLVD